MDTDLEGFQAAEDGDEIFEDIVYGLGDGHDDVDELLKAHSVELNTEELIKLKNEQKTLVEEISSREEAIFFSIQFNYNSCILHVSSN